MTCKCFVIASVKSYWELLQVAKIVLCNKNICFVIIKKRFLWSWKKISDWLKPHGLIDKGSFLFVQILCHVLVHSIHFLSSGPWFIIMMLAYQYRKSHHGDKMSVRSETCRHLQLLGHWQETVSLIPCFNKRKCMYGLCIFSHCVHPHRYEKLGYLEIDGTAGVEATSPGNLKQLNTANKLYIGEYRPGTCGTKKFPW